MTTDAVRLRDAALEIWKSGVAAVDSRRLVKSAVSFDGRELAIGGHRFSPAEIDRIAVVGAGKAGAGMATAFEEAVGDDLLQRVEGWVNVPADCVKPLRKIHLHAARPAGVNEPTADGVEGSLKILHLVSQLGNRDLCIVLLSGGGSALLPAPVEQISLEDKQAVTRMLMHAGATINELNCVRKHLSQIKGGGLARAAAGAGHVSTLVISDVIGDPLDVIASGPTVADSSIASDALGILEKYATSGNQAPEVVKAYLGKAAQRNPSSRRIPANVSNHVIGNNAVALNAAAERAQALGFQRA